MNEERRQRGKLAGIPAYTIPQDESLERKALGALLAKPDAAEDLIGELNVQLFNDVKHVEIFGAIVRLIKKGTIPEPGFVEADLQRRKKTLAKVFGCKADDAWRLLAAIIGSAPDESCPPAFPEYVSRLKELSARRELLKLSAAATHHALDMEASIDGAAIDFAGIAQRLSGGNRNEPISIESDPWHEHAEDGADIAQQVLPPVVEIVEGLITERVKFLIGSGSKSFKTWLTIYLALCIAHGRPFLGRTVTRRRVLYFNLELKADTFDRRVQAVAKALGITIERGWFIHLPLRGRMAGIDVETLVTRIIGFTKHFQADVAVCDPVYKMNTGDENSSRDQAQFFNQLDRITTEGNCTLILNDHFSKGNQSEKDPLDAIRGSSAKGGDVDAAMVLRRHDVENCFRVDVVHRELAPVEPFCIGWEFPLMQLRADLDPDEMRKPKGGQTKKHDPLDLLAIIRNTTPQTPVSVSGWAKEADISRQTLQSYLPSMRSKGWISTAGEGSSARQFITKEGVKQL